jgi:hypothetical protein
MARQSGMGHRLLIDGYDPSSDITAVNSLSTPMTLQDVTGIDKYAHERIGLLHDASAEFAHAWNPSNAGTGDAIHQVLRGLPTTDRQVTYLAGQTLGAPAFSLITKQVNYDWARNNDGSMTGSTSMQGNGYGGSWGVNLTAGKRTEAAAGNGSTVDLGAVPISYSFGWSAFLHVTAFTGTSVTVKIQDSADASAWLDLASATFTAATAIGAQRITTAYSSTATVRRYVRVVTTGTYSNAVYAVNFVRNEAARYPA